MANRILTYHFKSGTDKDGNPLYTHETRRQGQRVMRSKDGLYKDEAIQMSESVVKNPSNFGF